MSRTIQIILAEDNEVDVLLVRRALEMEGLDHQLQVLSDGEQVFCFLAEVESGAAPYPDILLLDLNMPKRSGEEILNRIRESAKFSPIPIVVVTSSDSPQDRQQSARLGVAHYFRKPCDLAEFMKLGAVIRAALPKS